MSRLFQKVMLAGEGAECGSQDVLLFLMEQCNLALLSRATWHLDKIRDYSLVGVLGHQNLVCGAQSKVESVVSLSFRYLLWKCRVWDIRT